MLADSCVTHAFTFHGSWKHIHLSNFCYTVWQLLKITRLRCCIWSSDIIGGCINRKQLIVSTSIKIILNKYTIMVLSALCGGHVHRHVLRPQCKPTSSGNSSPGVFPFICSSGYTSNPNTSIPWLEYYTVWSIQINSCYIVWGGGKRGLAMWILCCLPLGPENKYWPALFNSSLQLLFCYQSMPDALHKADGQKPNHAELQEFSSPSWVYLCVLNNE